VRAPTERRAARAQLRVPAREHQPGRDRLGVDAVRAAMAGVARVLLGALAAGRAQAVGAGEDLVARGHELQRERGVEDVGRRHAEVEPARRLAGQLLDVREEGDDVVARALLVLEDARRVELAQRPWPRTAAAVPAGTVLAGSPSPRRRPARRAATCRSVLIGPERTSSGRV
jgi:hypothetical protein